jgi:hypothetical protein
VDFALEHRRPTLGHRNRPSSKEICSSSIGIPSSGMGNRIPSNGIAFEQGNGF